MLDRAVELTIAHVSLRKQFGQPLSTFQGVQFQLTDAEVERSGLEILAKYALERRFGQAGSHRRCSCAADVGHRGGRGGLPGVPSAARRGRILRRDHAVVAPATASRCVGYRWDCRRPATS